MSEMVWGFDTPEMIFKQAKCFRLLASKIDAYDALQKEYPKWMQDADSDSAIGAIARMILEENRAEAFGEERE